MAVLPREEVQDGSLSKVLLGAQVFGTVSGLVIGGADACL